MRKRRNSAAGTATQRSRSARTKWMASRRSRVSESMSELKAQPDREHDRLQIEADAPGGRAALRAIVEVLPVDDERELAQVKGDAGVRQPADFALDVDAADAERLEVRAREFVRDDVRGA